MIHINFNCPCGIKLILAFNEYEFTYKCPKCGTKIIRRFNAKLDDYEILTEMKK